MPATTIESWLRGERLHRVHHGVYAVGHPSLTREERWLAAVLACGPGAVLSHLSAGALWGLVPADGERPDVTVARTREGHRGITVHRVGRPPRATRHRGIAVTTIAQTLLDLAATFTSARLERALGEAELHPFHDEAELERLVAASTGRRGVARLRRLLAGHEAGAGMPRNIMERRFRKLCGDAGLPRPECNRRLLGHEIDFLWRDLGVAVETDGRSIHQRRAAFGRDRRRDRDLQLAGYVALRFTFAEVMREPALVVAALRRAVAHAPRRGVGGETGHSGGFARPRLRVRRAGARARDRAAPRRAARPTAGCCRACASGRGRAW